MTFYETSRAVVYFELNNKIYFFDENYTIYPSNATDKSFFQTGLLSKIIDVDHINKLENILLKQL